MIGCNNYFPQSYEFFLKRLIFPAREMVDRPPRCGDRHYSLIRTRKDSAALRANRLSLARGLQEIWQAIRIVTVTICI